MFVQMKEQVWIIYAWIMHRRIQYVKQKFWGDDFLEELGKIIA